MLVHTLPDREGLQWIEAQSSSLMFLHSGNSRAVADTERTSQHAASGNPDDAESREELWLAGSYPPRARIDSRSLASIRKPWTVRLASMRIPVHLRPGYTVLTAHGIRRCRSRDAVALRTPRAKRSVETPNRYFHRQLTVAGIMLLTWCRARAE